MKNLKFEEFDELFKTVDQSDYWDNHGIEYEIESQPEWIEVNLEVFSELCMKLQIRPSFLLHNYSYKALEFIKLENSLL